MFVKNKSQLTIKYSSSDDDDCDVEGDINSAVMSFDKKVQVSKEKSLQTVPVTTKEMPIQTVIVTTKETSIQTEPMATKEILFKPVKVTTKEMSIQTVAVNKKEMPIQTVRMTTMDTSIQTEPEDIPKVPLKNEEYMGHFDEKSSLLATQMESENMRHEAVFDK